MESGELGWRALGAFPPVPRKPGRMGITASHRSTEAGPLCQVLPGTTGPYG